VSVARGEPTPDLAAFTPFFEKALRSARLVRKGQGYDLGFEPGRTLDGMLAPIAWSAVELLRGGELDRVKTCGKESCGWLFVDRSRNRSRRWCDMSDCGNAEKARRFHQRRAGRSRPPVATKSPAQPRPPR
jgi:predicted RNA-binding Zn ribbon-like protein